MRPKYFIHESVTMLYAVYPDLAYYALSVGWAPSSVPEPLDYFSSSPDYHECNLCDVRANFNNIKAHKRSATVASGT